MRIIVSLHTHWLILACSFLSLLSTLGSTSLLADSSKELINDKDKGILTIGVIAGFSGNWASYGQTYRQGIELANTNIDFIYEDDQFTPSKTISAFQKLVQHNKVDAVIIGDTVTGTAVAPLAIKFKVPTLIWSSYENVFSGNPYVIRLYLTPEEEFSQIMEHLNKMTRSKLAIISSPHSYSILWGQEVFKRYLGESKTLEELSSEQKDFRTHILKAKANNINTFALCLFPGEVALFARQLQQLRHNATIFSCSFIESSQELASLQSYKDLIYFFTPKIRPEFFSKVKKLYHRGDHLASLAIMYDAATLLQIASSKRKPSESLIDSLANLGTYEGAHSDSKVVKTIDDHYLSIPIGLYKMSAGDVQFLEDP